MPELLQAIRGGNHKQSELRSLLLTQEVRVEKRKRTMEEQSEHKATVRIPQGGSLLQQPGVGERT